MPPTPAITVVVSTYNRAALVGGALRSILAQDGAPPFELVVVDNNSTDATREAVEVVARDDPRVRYVFEGRQGVSHGRNAGVAAARAPLVAFTDDDVRAAPTWVASIARAFADHPDAAYVGGKVHALWPADPPAWLTSDHWSPLALVDYGDRAREVTLDAFVCLVACNLAVRRSAFDAVGGFDPRHQHMPGRISAIEDHEFQLRLLAAGYRGYYVPTIETRAEVQAKRLRAAHHLRWHFDHGRAEARMVPPGFEPATGARYRRMRPGARYVFGAPLTFLRGAAQETLRGVGATLGREPGGALRHFGRAAEQLGAFHYHVTVRARGADADLHRDGPPEALVSFGP